MENVNLNDPAVQAMANAQRMYQVIREMKEVPELPSEKPKDESTLERVEFPPSGGVLTYMSGHEYPYRGFPFFEFVDKIDFIKKVARGILSGLFHELKHRPKIWFITLIPALWFFKPLVYSALYGFHRLVVRSLIKPKYYSQAIQELYNAFSYEDLEDGKTRKVRLLLRDIVCMILEFDNAYRFRLQDAIENLDQTAVKKNTINELCRVLDSMTDRELGQDIKDTWRLVKLFCKIYLRIDGRMRRILGDVLSRIDLDKMKLTDEDKYYCPLRKDFQAAFLKGLRELKIKSLTPQQKSDRLLIEKAFATHELKAEKVKLIDKFNTKRALITEAFEKEKKQLTEELDNIKKSLKDIENTLNEEATKLATTTNRTIERTKGTEAFESTGKTLNLLLNEDIKALQDRMSAEIAKQNPISQKKIHRLSVLEKKFNKDSSELEKKFNRLLEQNRTAYPKKVVKLKKLCQQSTSILKKAIRRKIG